MQIINKYDYPTFERNTDAKGRRVYLCPKTKQYVHSVTTIIGETSDHAFLDEWKKRVGVVQAERESKESSELGTLMHGMLEDYVIHNTPIPNYSNTIYKIAQLQANAIVKNGLIKVQEVWGSEARLYMEGLYAGTTDLVGVFNGVPSIMDFKNSKKPKKLEHIKGYKIQLAAYAIAHNQLFGTDINQGVLFIADRTGGYQEFVFNGKEFNNMKDEWIETLYTFYRNEGIIV
jgi:genome maintenance exonuclease 1